MINATAATAAQVAQVTQAYDRATGTWIGADWTHEYDGPANAGRGVVYCDGSTPDCATCAAAAESSEDAEALAAEAMKHIAAGRWEEAETAAQDAVDLEDQWGDAPTWGPFLAAIQSAIEDIEDIEEQQA